MPSIPGGAIVPTFSRDFTQSLLGGTPANITRRCPDKVDSDSCGCDQDPYVRHECPFGGESCGCLRCPESFGPSFILHEGICYEACPADFRPAFFEAPPARCPDLTGTCVSKTHSVGPEYVGLAYTITQSGCTANITDGVDQETVTVTKNGDNGATVQGTGLGGWSGTVVGTKLTGKANDGTWSFTLDCTWTNNPSAVPPSRTYLSPTSVLTPLGDASPLCNDMMNCECDPAVL
jgi:hypothetical protein